MKRLDVRLLGVPNGELGGRVEGARQQAQDRRAKGREEGAHRGRGRRVALTTRVDEHQLRHGLRVRRGEIDGDGTAHARAHDVHGLAAEILLPEGVQMLPDRVPWRSPILYCRRDWRPLGPATRPPIDCDTIDAVGLHFLDDATPFEARRIAAVEEEDSRLLVGGGRTSAVKACLHVTEPIDIDRLAMHPRQRPSERRIAYGRGSRWSVWHGRCGHREDVAEEQQHCSVRSMASDSGIKPHFQVSFCAVIKVITGRQPAPRALRRVASRLPEGQPASTT